MAGLLFQIPVAVPSLKSHSCVPTFHHASYAVRGNASGWNLREIRSQDNTDRATKLVTFLGKGGSGKTISALLAAHYYARQGLRTCLVLQSQEPTADFLLGKRLSCSPTSFLDGALDAVRLETTKLLLEPLVQIKKADARLNFSQGALDEVVEEELSVLPGMDALLSLGAMERLLGFAGDIVKRNRKPSETYDIVVYDGSSSEETLRLVGAAEKSRWYLQRARSFAEKTDTGRVTAPSLLRLTEASLMQDSTAETNGRTISELWDGADRVLEKISLTFADPKRFACYLVLDPGNELSIHAALRYWGCAMQAGARVTGVLCSKLPTDASLKQQFSPLVPATLPPLSLSSEFDWDNALAKLNTEAKQLLLKDGFENVPLPVAFNTKEQTVTFFLPGFQKAEIKLSQWRGGSALLMEVGDQRRVVDLPSGLRGKVIGAKFEDKKLVVTMKPR